MLKKWISIIVFISLLIGIGCANRITPVTVGKHAAFYGARKIAARNIELIYTVDSKISSVQNYALESCKDIFTESTSLPPTEETPTYSKQINSIYINALKLFEQGKYLLAFKKFKMIAELYPSHPLADKALFWAAECCYLKGWFGEAKYYFSKLIKNYPDSEVSKEARQKLAELKNFYAPSKQQVKLSFYR